MKKNYTKIVLDLMMAITFVLLMNPRVLNGLPFHEIAGLVIGVAVLTHIGLNWRWVVNTTKKIFDPKLPKKTRFSYALNVLLLISMATIIITGILISKVVFPNLAVQGNRSIRGIHSLSADVTLVLVGLHIGVHWQWVMSICKKAFKTKEGKLRKRVIASVALSFGILAGGMQWYSSTAAPSMGGSKPVQMQQSGQSVANSNSSSSTTATSDTASNQNFRQDQFDGKDGKEGHGGSNNPFLTVLNYFAIWAAIIIPTYFLEKLLLRKKRKLRKEQTSISYKANI